MFFVTCHFQPQAAVGHGEKGDRIRLIGKLAEFDIISCTLKECELLAEIGRL
jgi:hypothetical protein